MKIRQKLALGVALAVAGSAAYAGSADLVVSPIARGASTEFQFDLLNDASATAFQFELKLDGAGGKVETSNCIGGLPSTHQGACSYKDGVLKVAVFSASLAPLSSGSIGSITVPMPRNALKSSVSGLLVADANGKTLSSDAIIDGGLGQENIQK
ncbi:MAG: hypothetical protein AAGA23_17760 [Pseudomonadota bacterium]